AGTAGRAGVTVLARKLARLKQQAGGAVPAGPARPGAGSLPGGNAAHRADRATGDGAQNVSAAGTLPVIPRPAVRERPAPAWTPAPAGRPGAGMARPATSGPSAEGAAERHARQIAQLRKLMGLRPASTRAQAPSRDRSLD